MKILGMKKSRRELRAFSLNTSSSVFSDYTGRHAVTTGAGVTSVGGKATFTTGNGGVIVVDNDNLDFSLGSIGDFRFSFKFQMTADPDTLSLLFALENAGYYLMCNVSELSGSLYVTLSAEGLLSTIRHPQIQFVGDPERSVEIARTGLVYSLSVDGFVVHSVASTLPATPSSGVFKMLMGAWATQNAFWDFTGTISDFNLVRLNQYLFNAQFATGPIDSTGRYTTTNVGGVTFSGGKAVWSTESPPRYLVTNEDVDWDHSKTLVVSARINSTTGTGVSKALWAISNAAANSYIRATHLLSGGGIIVQVNGTNLLSTSTYPDGVDYTLVVKYYSNGLTEIYVDGVLDGSGTLPTLAAASRKLYIGYSPTFVTFSHNGTIDYLTVEEV